MENNAYIPSSNTGSDRPQIRTLSDLPSGASGMISHLAGGRDIMARLAVLGFTPGARVDVVQNVGHGPMIVAVRGAQLALGRGEAQKVGVEIL